MKKSSNQYNTIDQELSQAESILDAVMEAGHAPCAELNQHEHAIWAAVSCIQRAKAALGE